MNPTLSLRTTKRLVTIAAVFLAACSSGQRHSGPSTTIIWPDASRVPVPPVRPAPVVLAPAPLPPAPVIVTPQPQLPPVVVRAPAPPPPAIVAPPTPALPIAPAPTRMAGLKGRMIVGYQGWFGCPGDAPGNQNWEHWFFNNKPDAANLSVDMLPSVKGIADEDLCPTGLTRADGTPIKLFSSQNPRVVAQHFRLMREHGIDGAAVQRFVGPLAYAHLKPRSDRAVQNARLAAEASGRAFYISYDVTGSEPATVLNQIRADWQFLVNDLKLTASPNYLHDKGKPVLQLWGFGFKERPDQAAAVLGLMQELKAGRGGLAAATLIGGVPSNWRTLDADSNSHPDWAVVYRSFDVISPWSVGRFGTDSGADNFARTRITPDVAETRRLGIGYMPVVFPGFSWYNLKKGRGESAPVNQIPRRCGNFMWRQITNALEARVDTLYAAMFDEVDEGTALFPVETRAESVPKSGATQYLNQDGCTLPEDWYLRLTGTAAQHLKAQRLPVRELGRVMQP